MFVFWKVYHLASVRLRDLCLKLDISAELRGKIWTCFEQSLVHCADLMKDRHLDQLLLCAVYIISKASTIISQRFRKLFLVLNVMITQFCMKVIAVRCLSKFQTCPISVLVFCRLFDKQYAVIVSTDI